jgi:branched-chain amino acid transport system permease protein
MTATTLEPVTADTDDPRVRWRPGRVGTAARLAVFAIALGVALWLPHVLPEPTVYMRAMAFGVIALSMNVLIGYAGQVSLGHQAFVGVGAFTAGYMLDRMAVPWLAATVAAIVLGSLISLGLGAVALRVRGLYFALVTIAYGLFIERTVFNITAVTGGGGGMPAPRPSFAQGNVAYAYVLLALLILTWIVDWRLTATKGGRAIQALRDDERVAASWGIDVRAHKLMAFAISGGMAALGGAMFASIEQIVSPITFGFGLGLTFVLMTVVGGVGSRPGVVTGGFVFAALPTLLKSAHEAWGVGEMACATAPPRAVQLFLGLAILGAVAEKVVHAFKDGGTAAKVRGSLAMVIALGLGGWLGLGGFLGWFCLWEGIDALWEPLIAAALLIVTLIEYPGGIAEQFGPVFNWLSFKKFGSGEQASAGVGGGGSSARP